jgi:hypothetical protein
MTDTEADPLPPAPEQLRLKLLVPATLIVITSFPLVLLDPDHAPDAEQLVALDEDQVIVTVLFSCTSSAELEIFIEGEGVDPPLFPSLRLLPPPPPPHELRRMSPEIRKRKFLLIVMKYLFRDIKKSYTKKSNAEIIFQQSPL